MIVPSKCGNETCAFWPQFSECCPFIVKGKGSLLVLWRYRLYWHGWTGNLCCQFHVESIGGSGKSNPFYCWLEKQSQFEAWSVSLSRVSTLKFRKYERKHSQLSQCECVNIRLGPRHLMPSFARWFVNRTNRFSRRGACLQLEGELLWIFVESNVFPSSSLCTLQHHLDASFTSVP